MKPILFLTLCFLTFSISTLAQTTETFDIATFQPPKGWKKQVGQDYIQFSTDDKASEAYCLITLFKSMPGLGSSKENFDAFWQTVVKEMVDVGAAEMQSSNNLEDWKLEMGSAPFEKNGTKGVAVLVTASGYGKKVNALVLTNTQTYEQAITAFLESVKLKKPETVLQPAPAADISATVLGTWLSSESDNSSYRVKNGVMSTIFRQYTFSADGTYNFVSKAYDPLMSSTLLGLESGTYQVSGSNITISPKKSVLEEWSKKNGNDEWGMRLKTQNIPLEKVTYQFTKQYNVLGRWELVLQATSDTFRDGSPGNFGTSNFAWYYPAVTSPGNPAIKLPR